MFGFECFTFFPASLSFYNELIVALDNGYGASNM